MPQSPVTDAPTAVNAATTADVRAGASGDVRRRVVRAVVPVVMLGLLLTAVLAWTAHVLDRSTERRLLNHQSRQAATLIESAILANVSSLQTAFGVANATDGSAAAFETSLRPQVGPGGRFVHAQLWRAGAGRPIAELGSAAGQSADRIARLVASAPRSKTFLVRSITVDGNNRIVYVVGAAGSRYVVYAERAIPANRQVPVESNPAFADLHFATYLGGRETRDALQTTDLADAALPMSGLVARSMIDFGDQKLLLVTTPIGHLGGSLNQDLPYLLLAGGVLLTALSAVAVGQLVQGRATAEADSRTITALYEQLDGSYREMRNTVELLQRALLPRFDPDIPGLEIASRYVAGARGVDIGGDWYTVVRVDDDHFAFAVGDVSGHGVEAAALMGRLRFTLRAYLLEGHGPDVALSMCSHDLDLARDGHMATALVGLGRLSDRSVTLASAGHPAPLVVADGSSGFLPVPTGRPLGVKETRYAVATHTMAPGAALIAFTDGLVERRGETMDVGLQRLADAVHGGRSLSSELDDVLRTVTPNGSEDDIAILALRWTT